MEMIPLKALARDEKKKPNQLRSSGSIPCIIYGNDMKNAPIQCEERELHKVFVKAGESTLVEIDLEGKKIPVLFKAVSFDPVSDRETHADFFAVNMKEEIETEVPVHFEGEAPAVKDLGGIFLIAQESVTVRCLPSDLPHNITADVSSLTELHSSVSVKDLILPKGVKVMNDPATVLVIIQEPRKEEVVAAPTAETAPAAGATTAEGATSAEGTTAAEGAAASGEKGKK